MAALGGVAINGGVASGAGHVAKLRLGFVCVAGGGGPDKSDNPANKCPTQKRIEQPNAQFVALSAFAGNQSWGEIHKG